MIIKSNLILTQIVHIKVFLTNSDNIRQTEILINFQNLPQNQSEKESGVIKNKRLSEQVLDPDNTLNFSNLINAYRSFTIVNKCLKEAQ